MNDEHTNKLFNDFPKFFKHRDKMQVSLMGFGFECRDGWFDLVYKLCEDIDDYYKNGVPEDFYVVQVKEKFGGLRFYITSAPMKVHDLIEQAEHDSFFICETCGKHCEQSGKKYISFYRDKLPWIQTLCDGCLRKHLDEKHLPFNDYVSDWQKEQKAPFVVSFVKKEAVDDDR